MRFVADLHLHSRFARATSRALNPENLYKWGSLKGLTVVGTGDFTHPAWIAELKEQLAPAEAGLYRLKDAFRTPVEAELYPTCRGEVRFLLSTEISVIYKKDGRTRKVHHMVLMPDFEAVERLNARLSEIGNLASDGRPILGLDSRDLVEICLEACADVLFIPAHIWTPHFAVLGSSSGFDSLEACFEDMLPHIFAVETGLSSDPPMNWRLSMLDRYAIVSNSDAHSPQKLAREGTCFDTELSYGAIYDALKTRDPDRFLGTLEFYPEEGKYHWDGHRKCEVRWKPVETLAAKGVCPVCGGKLTVGVLHRVEALADRSEGARSEGTRPYENLIPLPEIIGSALGVGPTSKKVQTVYHRLLADLGPELHILRTVPVEEVARCGQPLVAEGVRRMRAGEVEIVAGYDGVYGEIQVFSEADRALMSGQGTLFEMPACAVLPAPALPAGRPERKARSGFKVPAPGLTEEGTGQPETCLPAEHPAQAGTGEGLDDRQGAAVRSAAGPVVVVAGPGTGKTRVLTHRAAYLLRERGVPPGAVLAVTFTNRAAEEVRRRIRELLPEVEGLEALRVGTFHSVALDLLKVYHPEGSQDVVDEVEAREILADAISSAGRPVSRADAEAAVSLAKAKGVRPDAFEGGDDLRAVYRAYQERLEAYGVRDYDDVLLDLLELLEVDAEALEGVRKRFRHVLVDEFQDVNAVQYRLVRMMAGEGEGLFVIGDADQAIYGFRGASPAYFASVFEDFPSAHKVVLETTYRSTGQIVRAACAVIAHNADLPARADSRTQAGRQPVALVAARGEGVRCRLLSVPGETAEGIAVVREIGRMVGGADMLQSDNRATGGSGGEAARSFGDFGVLFRTGRQADELETCFLQEGLPYRIVGQKGFLEAEPVRQALAFFRYALRGGGDLRFLNALALPPFHPGRATLARLRSRAGEGALANARVEDLPPAAARKAATLKEAAGRFRSLAVAGRPEDLLGQWQEEFGAGGDSDFECLVRVAANTPSMEQLLDTVLMGREADYERAGGDGRPEAVTLMTLHAAKGLEFAVVFICGVEDGLIPYRERGADLAEERRLFYVGLTRARDEVVLLSARSRLRYGQRIRPEVSPFVRDIPADLIHQEHLEPPGRKEKAAGQLSLF